MIPAVGDPATKPLGAQRLYNMIEAYMRVKATILVDGRPLRRAVESTSVPGVGTLETYILPISRAVYAI